MHAVSGAAVASPVWISVLLLRKSCRPKATQPPSPCRSMDERRCVDQALRYLPLQARLECSAMRRWTVVALEWRCPSREPRTSTAGRDCILTVSVKRCRTSQALRYVIDSIHASSVCGRASLAFARAVHSTLRRNPGSLLVDELNLPLAVIAA